MHTESKPFAGILTDRDGRVWDATAHERQELFDTDGHILGLRSLVGKTLTIIPADLVGSTASFESAPLTIRVKIQSGDGNFLSLGAPFDKLDEPLIVVGE